MRRAVCAQRSCPCPRRLHSLKGYEDELLAPPQTVEEYATPKKAGLVSAFVMSATPLAEKAAEASAAGAMASKAVAYSSRAAARYESKSAPAGKDKIGDVSKQDILMRRHGKRWL